MLTAEKRLVKPVKPSAVSQNYVGRLEKSFCQGIYGTKTCRCLLTKSLEWLARSVYHIAY